MPAQEVLILAMTHMRSGICTAGFTPEPDPVTHLRWVRPVKEHGNVLLGDMTDSDGRVVESGDVVALELSRPRPQPPHTEDVLADLVYHRPRLLRRLEGDKWTRFLAAHLDRAPADVLVHQTRSLCLVRPEELSASFSLDEFSGKYQVRMGFRLAGLPSASTDPATGCVVTDLKWRALGREWLQGAPDGFALEGSDLMERLGASHAYLSLGLSRSYQGHCWLMVVGVHIVPDYHVAINYHDP